DLRNELPDGEVVEEEQRLGPVGGDVVDGHGDTIDPDGPVPAGVGGGGRPPPPPPRRPARARGAGAAGPERPPGAPAPPPHAGPVGADGRPDVPLDELDRLLARPGVDAGLGIGERLALPVGAGHGSTRAGGSRAASVARTFSSSRASFVSESGTGTGYSPLRQ